MIFRIIRKIFDPDYATKRVAVITDENKQKLDKVVSVTSEYKKITKAGDVTMIIFTAVGGRK